MPGVIIVVNRASTTKWLVPLLVWGVVAVLAQDQKNVSDAVAEAAHHEGLEGSLPDSKAPQVQAGGVETSYTLRLNDTEVVPEQGSSQANNDTIPDTTLNIGGSSYAYLRKLMGGVEYKTYYGHWVVYDVDKNPDAASKPLGGGRPSCVLVDMQAGVYVRVVSRNDGSMKAIPLTVPPSASAENETCRTNTTPEQDADGDNNRNSNNTYSSTIRKQELSLRWSVPPLPPLEEDDYANGGIQILETAYETVMDKGVITVFDADVGDDEKANETFVDDRSISDLAHEARFILTFEQVLLQDEAKSVMNFVSEIYFDIPFNVSVNNYTIAGIDRKGHQAASEATYRIKASKTVRIMGVPRLFAYHCREVLSVPMEGEIVELEMVNENVTQKAVGRVKVDVVFGIIEFEAFRDKRFYADMTHLKWDCVSGWKYGEIVSHVVNILLSCFVVAMILGFALRYRNLRRKKARNSSSSDKEGPPPPPPSPDRDHVKEHDHEHDHSSSSSSLSEPLL